MSATALGTGTGPAKPPAVRTLAVGFDGSVDAEAALRWGARLARQLGAEVVAVHAVGLLEHTRPAAGVEALEATVRRIGAEELVAPREIGWRVADGDPVSVLLRVGADLGADLLVVGSRGQGAHPGLLLGSTSLELAEHAEVPLLVVPSP